MSDSCVRVVNISLNHNNNNSSRKFIIAMETYIKKDVFIGIIDIKIIIMYFILLIIIIPNSVWRFGSTFETPDWDPWNKLKPYLSYWDMHYYEYIVYTKIERMFRFCITYNELCSNVTQMVSLCLYLILRAILLLNWV